MRRIRLRTHFLCAAASAVHPAQLPAAPPALVQLSFTTRFDASHTVVVDTRGRHASRKGECRQRWDSDQRPTAARARAHTNWPRTHVTRTSILQGRASQLARRAHAQWSSTTQRRAKNTSGETNAGTHHHADTDGHALGHPAPWPWCANYSLVQTPCTPSRACVAGPSTRSLH